MPDHATHPPGISPTPSSLVPASTQLSDVGNNDDDLYDEYLGALAALGGSAGNGRLRDVLEWDEVSYDTIKTELLNQGLILRGRGRGGSVTLADEDAATASMGPAGDRLGRRTRATRGSSATTASSFETAFRVTDDCLRKEDDRAFMALLEGRSPPILEEAYRWNSWAAPKDADGQLDHHAALTGDYLRHFVNQRLFPYLEQFKQRPRNRKELS